MNPILLQKQLKDNAADLNDFYKDLKAWGEDMKRKEESYPSPATSNSNNEKEETNLPKKKKKMQLKATKDTSVEKPKAKVGYTDYSAWDKFDVDAECEKIDYNENEESDLTDECDDIKRDEAYVQKEKGNKYVKDKKWDEAIGCYNKAIGIYSYDPVFYANRALCFLKKENYVKAELDCTMSIRLDSTYVKAYQRRAAAREALNKLAEAEADLLKVLELEPKNKESLSNLDALRKKLPLKSSDSSQRPVSKFTASRNKKYSDNKISDADIYTPNKTVVDTHSFSPSCGKNSIKPGLHANTDAIIPVKAVLKPVHMQSKKPLKRIAIEEVVEVAEVKTNINEPLPKPKGNVTLKTDDLKVVERQPHNVDVPEVTKENKNLANNIKMKVEQMEVCTPKNSVQFYSHWRHLKTIEDKYDYLKLIRPQDLPVIFKESLEAHVFSEILEILAQCFTKNNNEVFDFLKFFPEMRRFSTIILFLTENDKKHIWSLFEHVRQHENHPKEEIDLLYKKYEF